MKLLVISHFYTPWLNPRAIRWSAICEHWARQGFAVDVVSSALPGTARHEVLNGVSVHRVGSELIAGLREQLVTRLARNWEQETVITKLPVSASQSGRRLLKTVHDRTWKQVYWPDAACLWIRPSVHKAVELLLTDPERRLLTVSLPFSGHLAGLRVKRRVPGLRWVADVGDPFALSDHTPNNNRALYSRLNYRAEAKVLRCSDAIAVTTPAARRAYAAAFPDVAAKLHEIPPLVSLPASLPMSAPSRPRVGPRSLVYVGHLYRQSRSPDFLLRLFQRLLSAPRGNDLELHFYGDTTECTQSFEPYTHLFGRHIFLHGMRSRSEVFHAMLNAAVLVNIGNASELQLPSKVVEYATIGRPILNLIKSRQDSSLAFLEWYPRVLHVMDSGGAVMEETVPRVCRLLEEVTVDLRDERRERWLERFSVSRVAAQYHALLEPN